ncbi:ribonuclease T2 family protein [Jiella marina]|uniref:ribonuclease T2 family protein n=1 Tax=Jiella sp. LLJ827 TaxID=2917712 RepID=UPI002100FCB3|nr:ribonuclease T [Jiella sp. LLJ827]MCQ0989093.1 ribonuclease T [Jiella sp. LLJ827]
MRRLALVVLMLAASQALPVSAAAQEPLDGFVIARQACDATPSIRNAENERGTTLTVGQAYELLGENRANGSHYYVEVPGTSPSRRWIEKRCGDWVKLLARGEAFDRGTPAPGTGSDQGSGNGASQPVADETGAGAGEGAETSRELARTLVLAISWQPAFCERASNRPECRSQTGDRFDADHFSLHGLWPQPRRVEYCGVAPSDRAADQAGSWGELDSVAVDEATRQELARQMPGTQSHLDRHEWVKHGTCYGTSADEYFDDSLAVLEAINASAVRDLFAGAVGERLTRSEIRAAFDQAFGPGAGERVRVSCSQDGGRTLIGELTIGLVGEIEAEPDVASLMAAARPTNGGCREGLVDAVGLQ